MQILRAKHGAERKPWSHPWLAAPLCCVVWITCLQTLHAQRRLPAVSAASNVPAPIYWKQDLFLVPYQWSTPGEAGAAQAVWLYMSEDRGTTWQRISEARPNVTSFNYRAEGDGEYWFAVRTIDVHGRSWPASELGPELCVIVDTQMPLITSLTATTFADGNIEIRWDATDANLDLQSLKIDVSDDGLAWQPAEVRLAGAGQTSGDMQRAFCQSAPGTLPRFVRATIIDLAGNPASYQTEITAGSAADQTAMFPATEGSGNRTIENPATTPPSPPTGWVSSSTAVATAGPAPVNPQYWPAASVSQSPFRLSRNGAAGPTDNVTAYGNPPTLDSGVADVASAERGDQRIAARYAGPVAREQAGTTSARDSTFHSSQEPYTPLEPFRQATTGHSLVERGAGRDVQRPVTSGAMLEGHEPPVQPRLVGSRTFALEYDVDDVGRWGVTNVELWGTRDGGRTWTSYARDDDNRSPLIVTVDEEGVYGFRIAVEAAGSVAQAPNPGDQPELWVAVDLERPIIELTAFQRGDGNLADHLILRWRAADDNLEPRPISIFYSSRPGGPWSAVATNLENTGEYAWRVERHVPSRFYLRLEARDTAGNLAAYQTREPIEATLPTPDVQLRDAEMWGPTASGSAPSSRQ